jgi:hypothetical protein
MPHCMCMYSAAVLLLRRIWSAAGASGRSRVSEAGVVGRQPCQPCQVDQQCREGIVLAADWQGAPRLLWADFFANRIVPGMNRH